jgi:hypothetical protein
MTAELGGKQMVPIVINGELIRSTRQDFNWASPVPFADVRNLPGNQLVFIVENIPLSSKHRVNFILHQVNAHSDAKFVFITRGNVNLVVESDFTTRAVADAFNICEISFLEISHFIQKKFSMTGSEAGVVALRLQDTFSRFDLEAHPTYFAGIPREILAALLQANRRSELIQLAVDGYLTFLVADDKEDVALSRSTRARFLGKVVVEMNLEKRNFADAELVEATRTFAHAHDFDISPLTFIKAFVDHGIMYSDGNRMHISLPFIESYLLASELSRDPDKATAYFQFDDANFDLATFDLYAEIGACDALVNLIIGRLEQAAVSLASAGDQKHILLSEELPLANTKRLVRARALRTRLRKAAEDVLTGKDETHEKQQFLDLTERIRAAAARQSKIVEGRNEAPKIAAATSQLDDACRYWIIATVLLGSGAEHLGADVKRRLCTGIVQLASRIIDEWTRFQTAIDFAEIKKELTTDDVIAALPKNKHHEDKKKLIEGLIDLLQYHLLLLPLLRVVGYLCEQARHRVLATSVENAKVEGGVERIIHGTWLSDIDSSRGGALLRKAIKVLPNAPLLRVALASHYLYRVYWNHWEKTDRVNLLDLAEEVIKPLYGQFDKGKLKRMIEKDAGATHVKYAE